MLSQDVEALVSIFPFFLFSLQLTADTPSLLLFFLVSSFFLLASNQQALFSSSCHCYTLSLSWDPFDVVRHYEITLHLGQFSVWWLILHEPISRAFQHSRTSTREEAQAAHTHLFITKENETRWVTQAYAHTQKEDILILLFYYADKERGERHHGYYPSGPE